MDCGLLYSGGKDSTLAALVLDDFFDVTLVSGSFGIGDAAQHGREAAEAVGFPFETLTLEREVAVEAVKRMVEDGYPSEGIQIVHEHAVERIAADGEWDAIADGTRRDDRAPTVARPFAQSVEDRFDVEYVAPLAGFGRGAIDRLVEERLVVETGPSEQVPKADYETELRALMAEEYGERVVGDVFPDHTQSRVVDRR